MENNEIEFTHKGKSTDQLVASVADIRDLIQAFSIPDEGQRLEEINLILSHIEHKSRLQPETLKVVKPQGLTGSKFGSKI